MAKTWDKIQTGPAGKATTGLWSAFFSTTKAKTCLIEKYKVGRDKKFHRKFKPAEKGEAA
jgi:hypothetical protein